MSTRRKRWILRGGLACFILGAIIAPLALLLEAVSVLMNSVTSGGVPPNTFTYFDDVWNIRGNAVWFITAWIGASLGGATGIVFTFAITKLKKL